MSSAERPEADAAEQSRPVDPTVDERGDVEERGAVASDLEADVADVLDQLVDADLPDEDESRT